MQSFGQFYRVCLLAFLALESFTALASSLQREDSFTNFMQQLVEPWFAQGESGFFLGTAVEGRPVRLRYKAFRQEQARADLIFVHGFGERLEKYSEMAFDLYKAGFNVFLYDQRGFGESTRLQKKTLAVYVDHFSAYAVDLKIFTEKIVQTQPQSRPLIIFAHSMGGGVASQFANLYPSLAQALILSAPMHEPQLYGIPRWLAAGIATSADMLGFGQSYIFGQKPPAPASANFEKAATQSWARWNYYQEWLKEQPARAVGGASFHWLREALLTSAAFSDPAFVAAIKAPILLFQAGTDAWVNNAAQEIFCSLASSCVLIKVPLTRHEIYREKDQYRLDYMQQIFSFLDKQAPNLGPLPLSLP